jgi:hypothetical protein
MDLATTSIFSPHFVQTSFVGFGTSLDLATQFLHVLACVYILNVPIYYDCLSTLELPLSL